MLGKLRVFSKSKLAIVLVGIIIIPFVFWGMGSVFSSGNTNSIAKIDNKNISTKEFIDHLNSLNLSQDVIKKNIEQNVLEELLAQLISQRIMDLEIKNKEIYITEENLAQKLKNNKQFAEEENKFSRIKYEKFLLENNMNAVQFESRLKKRELQKKLFNYVSGGIIIPKFMLENKINNDLKNIHINYISLNDLYKKQFTNEEIDQFIFENKEELKIDLIDLKYTKINPQNLIQSNEFDKEFFKKIDQIENQILNKVSIEDIASEFSLKLFEEKDFSNNENIENNFLNEIYKNRNETKTGLIDKDDFYLLYEIKSSNKVLPNKNDKKFITKVKDNLIFKEKYDYNVSLLEKIQSKSFTDEDFGKLGRKSGSIKKVIIKSIKDNNKFDINSIKLIYSLPLNSFILISDDQQNIFLSKITNIENAYLDENKDNMLKFSNDIENEIKKNLYTSYDSLINNKYKVTIYNNTLDRVKNYFR